MMMLILKMEMITETLVYAYAIILNVLILILSIYYYYYYYFINLISNVNREIKILTKCSNGLGFASQFASHSRTPKKWSIASWYNRLKGEVLYQHNYNIIISSL